MLLSQPKLLLWDKGSTMKLNDKQTTSIYELLINFMEKSPGTKIMVTKTLQNMMA